jgi:hypothetical protein
VAATQDQWPVPSAHFGRDPARAFGLARALPDMSQFAAELCEYCADIAPIAPSLRGVL